MRSLAPVQVRHDASKYDGYRLTNQGYDYLALRALVSRGVVQGLGRQIGVGKESDVYEAQDEEGDTLIIKFHRLGRTSFRAVKSKRDYLRGRTSFSWLYLNRLAAKKEFAFMRALRDRGLPVPEAIDHNRHAVVMSKVHGTPLCRCTKEDVPDPAFVYRQIMENLVAVTALGLVHCDFNEFNIMMHDDGTITFIDFPQMISVKHPNALALFERDVDCILRFFDRKLHFHPDQDPGLGDLAYPDFAALVGAEAGQDERMDRELRASGFHSKDAEVLDRYIESLRRDGEEGGSESDGEEEESGSESDGEEEESGSESDGDGDLAAEDGEEVGGEAGRRNGHEPSARAEQGEPGGASEVEGEGEEEGEEEWSLKPEVKDILAEQMQRRLNLQKGKAPKGSRSKNANKHAYGRRNNAEKHKYRPKRGDW